MKSKHLKRALEQMAEEGVTRVFKPLIGTDWIVGVVGPLQIEVLAERIGSEYDLKMHFETAPYETARWITCADKPMLKRMLEEIRGSLAEDHDGAPVFMARNAWELNRTIKDWPDVTFHATREQGE
jgi:peptide chain release factor 3